MQSIILKVTYFITIFFLTVSGFGQLPIFKRYYIADIPGLEWLAKFYVTHTLHYIFSIILVGLIVYIIVDNILSKEKTLIVPFPIYTKLFLLSGLMITGIFMGIKNYTGTPFSPSLVIILDLTHLTFCMAFLVYSLHTLLTRQKGLIHNL